MDNFFSHISTSFIFEDLRLRSLPILHLQNYLRDLEYLGSFVATTLKSLRQHHISDKYFRSSQVFTQPRLKLIVYGRMIWING